MQEVKTVIPDNSPAQSEEEQLHPLSKRRKLGPAGEGVAKPVQQVSEYCFLLVDP